MKILSTIALFYVGIHTMLMGDGTISQNIFDSEYAFLWHFIGAPFPVAGWFLTIEMLEDRLTPSSEAAA